MRGAPRGYKPHFFRLAPQSKAPATEYGSWKDPKNRLTIKQAVKWMKQGGNVGIAGMIYDPLVNVDLDGSIVRKELLKPTLTTRSRSRTGIHGFYFTDDKHSIPNIPTDDQGEVRAQGQYVVAAGSYVPTDPETVPIEHIDTAGYYTVEDRQKPAWITYSELPKFFREAYEKRNEPTQRQPSTYDPKQAQGKHSAVFDINATDVMLREIGTKTPTQRWGSIFHDSETEANMSISNRGLLQCWRHGVSHNGLQALVVLSGYMTCLEAGTPHKGGHSKIVGDNGAILYAWLYAKEHGYIPIDDPIPIRALNYIAEKHLGYKNNGHRLPHRIYCAALKILEEAY